MKTTGNVLKISTYTLGEIKTHAIFADGRQIGPRVLGLVSRIKSPEPKQSEWDNPMPF